MDKILTVLGVVALVVFAVALSFGCTFALVYGVCWAFGLTFSWKIAIGVWFVLVLLKSVFSINSKQ